MHCVGEKRVQRVQKTKDKMIVYRILNQNTFPSRVLGRSISMWTSMRIKSDSMGTLQRSGYGFEIVHNCNKDADMELNTHLRSVRGVQRIGRE